MAIVEQTREAESVFPTDPVTGGEAVYWALRALGVEHVFGIVSIHNIPMFEAIDRLGGITHVSARHEANCTHAADGYSRATGKLGVVIASTGPGTTNTATGLLEAATASSRVLVITGQTMSSVYGTGKGYLHEFENQLTLLRTVAPHSESVRSRAEIRDTILGVARRILSDRPQPGAVQIPTDFQWAKMEERETEWTAPEPVAPSPDSIDQAVEILASAKRPVIWAGGGVAGGFATDALRKLAEQLGAPVFLTSNARGSLPFDHPNNIGAFTGVPAAWDVLRDADAMLAVGTRFTWGATGDWRAPVPPALIHIDVDPRMINLNYRAQVRMIGDARLGLEALSERLESREGDAEFLERARSVRGALESQFEEHAGPEYRALGEGLLRSLPEDAIVVGDVTQALPIFAQRFIPVTRPRSSFTVNSGAIGPGAGLAIGAAVGSGSPVILIQGDGGFMLSVGELATMAESRARVIVLVFNDKGYGAIRMLENISFGERHFATELNTPDFVAVAQAMGVDGTRVGAPDEFGDAFERAVESGGPYLIDIDLTKMPSTWPVEYRKRAFGTTGGTRLDRF